MHTGKEYIMAMKKIDQVDAAMRAKAAEAKKAIEDVAKEVIRGDWGSGETRKTRLTEAGFDYEAVQKEVNRILAEK